MQLGLRSMHTSRLDMLNAVSYSSRPEYFPIPFSQLPSVESHHYCLKSPLSVGEYVVFNILLFWMTFYYFLIYSLDCVCLLVYFSYQYFSIPSSFHFMIYEWCSTNSQAANWSILKKKKILISIVCSYTLQIYLYIYFTFWKCFWSCMYIKYNVFLFLLLILLPFPGIVSMPFQS